jgi:hypothetical protein
MTIQITSDLEMLNHLEFKPYSKSVERQAFQFFPGSNEPQKTNIQTPWGETLTCEYGDYIVNEMDESADRWPVQQDIFENSYFEVRPGYFVKRPLTHLVPLVDITQDPDADVIVHTLEGAVTVRAGDFYLARGIQGEIWPYPKNKADTSLVLVESPVHQI